MDCTQIGKIVKRDPKTVWKWLKKHGIETRPRGDNWRQLPLDGSPFRGKSHTEKFKAELSAISIKDGRVPYLKNGVHWMAATGRKPSSWRGGITPERQAFYATKEWKECVRSVWKRDDAFCQMCGLNHRTIERGNPRFTIHHIDSFMIKERRAVLINLLLVCQPCHYWIHSSENIEGVFLGAGHKSTRG